MGFFDFLKGTGNEPEEERPVANAPLLVSVSFTPIRLSAHKESSVQAIVRVKNNTNEQQLVSLDLFTPKDQMIGFDTTCLTKKNEKRLETLAPQETKEVAARVFSSNQTKPGTYSILAVAYAHYQTYEKVVSTVKKKVPLRVA